MDEFIWNAEVQKMVEEYLDEANEESAESDTSTISHKSLDETDLRYVSIVDRAELKSYNDLRTLKELRDEYQHHEDFSAKMDEAIASFKATLPHILSEVEQMPVNELKNMFINDPRFPLLEDTNIGIRFKILNVFDEAQNWLVRHGIEEAAEINVSYGCICGVKLDPKHLEDVLLHIAIEHVNRPTSFSNLFIFYARLFKDGKFICVACNFTSTERKDFLFHFTTERCCNIKFDDRRKIKVEDINKKNLEKLLNSVTEYDLKHLMKKSL